MGKSVSRLCLAALVVLAALVALAHILYYLPRTVDDLFIYLRYAENLAQGRGLVYNPGERVEGFSSPPWVLLQSLAFLLGVNAVTFTKILGVLAFAAYLAAAGLLALELTDGNRFIAAFVCLILALNSCLVSWSVLGLETPLFLALMLWTVFALLKYMEFPAPGRRAWLVAAAFFFALSRPEAPLFLAAILLAVFLAPHEARSLPGRLKVLAPAATLVALLFALFLVSRYAYYGSLVPHVFFAKHGSGIEKANLLPLVANGASPAEVFFTVGGMALSVLFARNRKFAPLAAVIATTLLFAALVKEDWMPNLRFLLPLFAPVTLAWMTALHRVAQWAVRRRPALLLAAAVMAAAVLSGLETGRAECRFMTREFKSHGGSKEWVRYKSLEAAGTTIQCLRRKTPEGIESMPIDSLGMIHQLFDVLETSDLPLEDSWYLGRDIGRVGYFSQVRVFDTDGLFTPALSSDAQWSESGAVSAGLVEKAFSHQPLAAELLDGWGAAVGRDKEVLKHYEVANGSPDNPRNLRLLVPAPPSMDTVLARYRKAMAKLPVQYFVQTLHGEALGAAMLRRYEYMEDVGVDHKTAVVPATEADRAEGHASFPRAGVLARGCTVWPNKAEPGGRIAVTCYLQRNGLIKRSYRLFLHFDGPIMFKGDHLPVGGLLPTYLFPKGTVRDVFRMTVPHDAPAGDYTLFFGLFTDQAREHAAPPEATDGNDRVKGPQLKIL